MLDSIDLSVRPCLLVEGGDPVEIPAGGALTIGRDPSCDLVVEADERVSRQHARVRRDGDRCFVEDLESQNGTFVNEEKIEGARELTAGDRIRISGSHLTYALDPSRPETPIILEKLEPARDPRFGSLLAIAEAVANLHDEEVIARCVLAEVLPVVKGERGLVLALEPAGTLKPLAALFADGRTDEAPPHSRTILKTVMDRKVALLSRDAQDDQALKLGAGGRTATSIRNLGLRSVCCVPLLFRDTTLGILQVTSPEKESFGAIELSLLTAVARVMALALESARGHRERARMIASLEEAQVDLKVRAEQFRLLYRLEHQLSTTHDVPQFLQAVARQAVAALGAEAGAIFLVDEATGRISFAYPSGGKEREVRHQTFERGRGFVGHVVESGEALCVNDVPSSPHFDKELAQQFGVVPRNLVAVPLLAPHEKTAKVIGCFEVLDKKHGRFSPGDQQLLTFLAAQVSTALVRMRMQEDRERRERLATIGRMASSIVHDLRSPLTLIMGYLDILARGDVDEQQRTRMTRVMRGAVRRMANMVREVLDFARDEVKISRDQVLLHEWMADIEEELQPELKDTKVRLLVRLDYAGPAEFDPERVRRVILNLVSNGIAAMRNDPSGTLALSTTKDDAGLVIEVADTGPGIPAEFRPKLFTPFATQGKKDGTGLGLSIAHAIVAGHGGTLVAEDASPRGTRFVIRLPQ